MLKWIVGLGATGSFLLYLSSKMNPKAPTPAPNDALEGYGMGNLKIGPAVFDPRKVVVVSDNRSLVYAPVGENFSFPKTPRAYTVVVESDRVAIKIPDRKISVRVKPEELEEMIRQSAKKWNRVDVKLEIKTPGAQNSERVVRRLEQKFFEFEEEYHAEIWVVE